MRVCIVFVGMYIEQVMVMQPQVQQVANQGQVIMVQMPDGRMVPAQVQGGVQPQMVQYQQQPQQVQTVVVPQPQQQTVIVPQPSFPQQQHAYNPEMKQNGGGQVEPVTIAAPYVPQQPPAYNPGGNGIVEDNEGGEGGKPTNGGYNFQ